MRSIYNIFLSLIILCLCASPALASRASGEVRKANALYRKGNFADALDHYEKALSKEPQSAAVEYGLGTALYKRGNYNAAIDHLNKALLSEDVKLQTSARYNLGNAHYKSGIKQEKKNIDEAIAALEKSLGQYEKVIASEPQDADAKFNHQFVTKELERLRKKKEEQKQQKNQQQNQQQKNQDQQQQQDQKQDQNQDQGGESKDQKDQQSKDQQSKDQQSKDQQQQGQQDQQKQDQKQGDQNKEDQKQNGQGQKDKDQDQKSNENKGQPEPSQPQEPSEEEQGQQPQQGDGMTPAEANMVLGDYERNEEPKGLLYFVPQSSKEKPVLKDW